MSEHIIRVQLNPDENFFRYRFSDFLKEQVQYRSSDEYFRSENYAGLANTSFEYLLQSGRFRTGGISWIEEKNSGKILALSGFYQVDRILIAGVRTLIDLKKENSLLGIHAKLALPQQILFAQDRQLAAVAVTFNQNNFRIVDFIERHRQSIESLAVYRKFLTIKELVNFNYTDQKVMWMPLLENCTEDFVISALRNFR